jgi:hypothetical protein
MLKVGLLDESSDCESSSDEELDFDNVEQHESGDIMNMLTESPEDLLRTALLGAATSATTTTTEKQKKDVSYYCNNIADAPPSTTATAAIETTDDVAEDIPTSKPVCRCQAVCLNQFTIDEIYSNKLDCLQLATQELDLVLIIVKLHALTNTGQELMDNKKPGGRKRSHQHTKYFHKAGTEDLLYPLPTLPKPKGICLKNVCVARVRNCNGIFTHLTRWYRKKIFRFPVNLVIFPL